MQFTLISINFTNRWSKGVVSWSSDVILHKSYFRKLCTTKISENNRQKLALFCYQYKDMTEWEYQHKDLFWNCWQVTQYRGIVFNMAYDLLRAVLQTWLYDVGCPKVYKRALFRRTSSQTLTQFQLALLGSLLQEAEPTKWGLVEQSTCQWSWIASLNCAAFIGGH